ncbi:hypothetical protein [Lentzea aerocolonigenes]|nr:hypothetical protein [Lentzea aerocolonigenes]
MIKKFALGLTAGMVLAASLAGLAAVPATAAGNPCGDRGFWCKEMWKEPEITFKDKAKAQAALRTVQANCNKEGGTVVRAFVDPRGDEWEPVVFCRLPR